MNDFDKIIMIAKKHHNIINTKMVVEAGIRKEKLKELVLAGKLRNYERGWYAIQGAFVDRYYAFQCRFPSAIYSYSTAAYFLGLLDCMYPEIECTFPRGVNASRIKTAYNIKYHFVSQEIYELGIFEFQTAFGSKIRIYDKERVICEYIKNKSRIDIRVWGTVLNAYFRRRDKDLNNLVKYARKFEILDELEMYVELLQ